jgi:uncharacterized protein (TIGR03067 family)
MFMVFALTVLTDGFVAAHAWGERAIQEDLGQLQGTWKAVTFHVDGKPVSAEELNSIRVVIQGTSSTITRGGASRTGELTLDPTRNPKIIDILLITGADQGTTLRGIYDLSGDTFRVCLALPGRQRPTDFDSRPG